MKAYTVFFLVKNLTPLLLKNPNLSSPPYLSFRKASENSGESPVIQSLFIIATLIKIFGAKFFILFKNSTLFSICSKTSDCVISIFKILPSHYSTLFDYKLGLLSHFLSVFYLFLPLFATLN